MTSLAVDWLRVYRPRPAALVRLLCLPHAGGSAAFFRPWADLLPDTVELSAIQYPGRLDRLDDPFVTDLGEMVDTVTEVIQLDPIPTVLFGHSMGAVIAFEVARRMEAVGRPARRLIVSGRQPPQHHRPSGIGSDDDALWAEVVRLGILDDQSVSSPELRAIALPSLRADYALVDSYSPRSDPIATRIDVFGGNVDPDVSLAELADWARCSRSGCEVHLFTGHHFYLVAQRGPVVAEVARVLASVTTAAPPDRPAGPR